jgi:hypothetical protein
MNTKVIVAAHKPYDMPQDSMYLPVQVGAAGKAPIGFVRDDSGDHISSLNPWFCELTGMYWAWKNLDADAIGLAHYRRHFKGSHKDGLSCGVLSSKEADHLLQKTGIILPKRRQYYIESLYSHYAHTHYARDLDETRKILEDIAPAYVPSFDRVMERTWGHMFNMMIMKRKYFDEYCSFLFPVLFALYERGGFEDYDPFQARLFGRISELLLDVWLDYKGYSYAEVPVAYMEKVPWVKKGIAFLQAKLFKKKYTGSF